MEGSQGGPDAGEERMRSGHQMRDIQWGTQCLIFNITILTITNQLMLMQLPTLQKGKNGLNILSCHHWYV